VSALVGVVASASQEMKRFLWVLATASVFLSVVTAGAAPPRRGEFVVGKTLAGIRLGMTKEQVLDAWGARHGVCTSCPRETWYFNYTAFAPQGAGVAFRRDHVVHVFTVWRPTGWRTAEGLTLGAPASDVARLYGSLDRRQCTFYYALLKPTKRAQSVFYVFRDKVWGFGLIPPNASPCL
jgi:hypothetical protein